MSKITTEQIISIIEQHHAETGKIPSIRDITGKIGGSYSTVGPVLRVWTEEYEQNKKALNEMPLELRNAMDISLASIWKKADDIASEKVGQYKKIMDQQRVDHEQELSEMEKTIDELQATINKKEDDSKKKNQFELDNVALNEKINTKNAKIEELTSQIKELTQENKDLLERLFAIAESKKEHD